MKRDSHSEKQILFKSRIVWVFLFLLILWGSLILRGAYLQILPHQKLSLLEKRQFATTIEVTGRRGSIVDRKGRELAISVGALSLFADPAILERPRWVARRLSTLLRISRSELQTKLIDKKKRFVWVQHYLKDHEIEQLRKWDIRGLGFIEESRRVYPQDKLLFQSLGFVGVDGQGLEGLELQYDSVLSGEKKTVVLPRDAHGRPLLPEGNILTAAKDGAQIQLTIDSQIQFILEKELKEVVEHQDAEGGVGVILDPQSGEVLALASQTGRRESGSLKDNKALARRNRALTDAFEAGSVMKAFVIAAALRSGQVKPGTRIDCEKGRLFVGGQWIREAEAQHVFGQMSVAEILAYSSNIGTAKIALALGSGQLRQSLLDFGFGQKLGLDLPGESRGILQPLPWKDHLLSNISFGHGLAVTPLQIAAAYGVFANGGFLKRPFILKKMIRGKEEIITVPMNLRRVLTEEQAATMRHMLRAATMEHATGVKARVPGFPVAGKTGTAQKVDFKDGGYQKGAYIASFAGFIPAHAPKFVIFVAIDHPRQQYYAAQVAAPVFARLAQYVVRSQGLAPVLLAEQGLISRQAHDNSLLPLKSEVAKFQNKKNSKTEGVVPDLKGLTLREVYQQTQGLGVHVDFRGRGVVVSSRPAAGSTWPENNKIRVFLEPVE